jgi:hypothetical protein
MISCLKPFVATPSGIRLRRRAILLLPILFLIISAVAWFLSWMVLR